MSRVSDHDRRDAEHAARAEISIMLSRYARRLYEEAKAHIATAITDAEPGQVVDGTQIGRDAARSAIASYLGVASAEPSVELEAGDGETAPGS